ncbi:magnesium-translocating P-type ATPase [Terriglobus albidus]|uniref:Magnesium-transporting ATPase, P-type 1 n=1 Tax=Terriglobus albidus TaxID=1592106 RepID=A0A5B9EIM9_9BACT|nr:magnesium-translocating P-type ATPase [Terriglobus albidus]QEE30261.1 magnesium-translocating P-type ATPase [Terriglobus albidus]
MTETDIEHEWAGLTSAEAETRLAQYGFNEPAGEKQQHWVLQFLKLFLQPLPLILLIAACISSFIGQLLDASIIAVMVTASAIVDFYQTYRSQVSMEKLRRLVAPTGTVLRDGAWVELDRRNIVPGDVVRMAAGDLVPADCTLLEVCNLYVQEAVLTGESLPSVKAAASDTRNKRLNQVYLGTSIASGSAIASVVKTGAATEFGEIAQQLSATQEETDFDRGLRQFALLISRVVLFLVLFVLLANLAVHRSAFESLLFAVALAVGLTPELLPVLTSITLAKAAIQLAQKDVIVKHLSAIQNLGSIDILCSDKTGTLTLGEMHVFQSLDYSGVEAPEPLRTAKLNSLFEAGVHSPLDAAILEAPPPAGEAATNEDWEKLDELPFDFERRRLSIVLSNRQEIRLICKGAPEGLLPLCTSVGVAGHPVPLTPEARKTAERTLVRLADDGLRVLAVAERGIPSKPHYVPSDECDLTLVGFLTFTDPVRPDAAGAIQELAEDGVAVKIITGDNADVAKHLCQQIDFDTGEVLLGDDLDRMTDTALAIRAEKSNLFARVSPAQKSRILRALRSRGHVVGFIGDGINDAPSLRAADIGIAAPHAVDVARAAADIILLTPGYSILHQGIRSGRNAFGNVMKYLMMGTSSNFGNVLSMAVAAVMLPFLPMSPTQVLLNNFLYDMSQIPIPTDNVDPEYSAVPRSWDMTLIRRFMLLAGPISSIFDVVTFYVLLHFMHAGETEFHTGWFIESLFTQIMVLLVIRTTKAPWRSRPSRPLAISMLAVLVIGFLLPVSPAAGYLGFTPLPGGYYLFLLVTITLYLGMVEAAKRWLLAPASRRLPRAAVSQA